MKLLLIYNVLPLLMITSKDPGMREGLVMIINQPWVRLSLIALLVLFSIIIIVIQTRNLIAAGRLLKEKQGKLDNELMKTAELESRAQNLTESLVYAQRIQEALLPSEDYFRKHFRDSFIFFKPKDIVSGDFYWIGEKDDKVIVVAADCTGHGVPGALMSMLGHEIIEKTINEDNIHKPAEILEVLNQALEKTFSSEKNIGTIIRDGMDIGLCVVDKKKKKLEYSGAFFPLYLIRDNTLTEVKGDKIIIGMNPERRKYSSQEIDLEPDDIVYIFSDGYVDQFGGNDYKKFMYRRFRYLLTRIHTFPVSDQKAILEENINSWMAGHQQLDDMMVLGFRPLSRGAK